MCSEKRQLKRVHLIYYLQLYDAVTDTEAGYLVDITTKGLMMLSPKPVLSGRCVSFNMQLPAMISDLEKIQFSAKCLWCKEDFNPHFYLSGYRIKAASPQEAETIIALTNTYGFKSK